jgi:hypothetical protein
MPILIPLEEEEPTLCIDVSGPTSAHSGLELSGLEPSGLELSGREHVRPCPEE